MKLIPVRIRENEVHAITYETFRTIVFSNLHCTILPTLIPSTITPHHIVIRDPIRLKDDATEDTADEQRAHLGLSRIRDRCDGLGCWCACLQCVHMGLKGVVEGKEKGILK